LQQSEGSGEDMFGMEENIRQLKEDIDLRNAQIADLQQKILDSDQGKIFSGFHLIHGMLKCFIICNEASLFLLQ
jgi:hypothetical protein